MEQKIVYVKPDPCCPYCYGKGEVDYGSSSANILSFCFCVEEQVEDDATIILDCEED